MSDLSPFLSTATGALGTRVEDLVRRYARQWFDAPAMCPPSAKGYRRAEKRAVEQELSGLVAGLSSEPVRTAFLDGSLEADRLEELAHGLRPAFKRLLQLVSLPLEAIYDSRFIDSTRRFLRAARDFDPDLSLVSAYQALRNVWIMNSLQFDLGLPVEHTDAIFAYSMVYPYLDNMLDDARIAEAGKLDVVSRLRNWLEGSVQAAESPREEKLRSLVLLIEGRYPRHEFPLVYQSLMAIYNAQVKSLLQQSPDAAPSSEDILSISLEKGGTSVLADGYLVAGALKPEDEEFCFGFGTFLQMADDLQDIAEDSRFGHRTLFSRQRGGAPLDAAELRLESYLAVVLKKARRNASPNRTALCGAIGRGLELMFRESVAKQPEYFSRRFVRQSRREFPVRFSYLRKLRRRLKDSVPAGCDRLANLDPGLVALMAMSSRAFALE